MKRIFNSLLVVMLIACCMVGMSLTSFALTLSMQNKDTIPTIMEVGKTYQLPGYVVDPPGSAVTYVSSDTTVATVDSATGLVTTKKIGAVKFSVKSGSVMSSGPDVFVVEDTYDAAGNKIPISELSKWGFAYTKSSVNGDYITVKTYSGVLGSRLNLPTTMGSMQVRIVDINKIITDPATVIDVYIGDHIDANALYFGTTYLPNARCFLNYDSKTRQTFDSACIRYNTTDDSLMPKGAVTFLGDTSVQLDYFNNKSVKVKAIDSTGAEVSLFVRAVGGKAEWRQDTQELAFTAFGTGIAGVYTEIGRQKVCDLSYTNKWYSLSEDGKILSLSQGTVYTSIPNADVTAAISAE